MANKAKTVKVSIPANALDGAQGDSDDDLDEEEQDFLAALTEVEGAESLRWQLWRIKTAYDPKPPGFVAELSATELKLSEVQTRYGAGKYKVRGINAKGQYVGGKSFEIANDITRKEVAPRHETNDVLTMLQSLNEREERRAEKSSALWALALPAAIAAIPALMQAMRGTPNDPLTMIAALKTLQPTAPDHSALLLKLIDVAADNKGGGEESPFLSLAKDAAKDLLPALANKLNAMPSAAPPSAIPIHATVQPAELAVAQQPQNAEEQSMFALLGWAKQTLQYLTSQAQKNSDPELYADWLMDNVPTNIDIRKFAEYLRQENWADVLQQFHEPIKNHLKWFAEFRVALIMILDENEKAESGPLVPPNDLTEGEHDE